MRVCVCVCISIKAAFLLSTAEHSPKLVQPLFLLSGCNHMLAMSLAWSGSGTVLEFSVRKAGEVSGAGDENTWCHVPSQSLLRFCGRKENENVERDGW